jgi:hypothetical protein
MYLSSRYIHLYTAKAYASRGVYCRVNGLEHTPPAALPLNHYRLSLLPELHQMQVVASTHRCWHNNRTREPTLIKYPLGLQLFHGQIPIMINHIRNLIMV